MFLFNSTRRQAQARLAQAIASTKSLAPSVYVDGHGELIIVSKPASYSWSGIPLVKNTPRY